MDNLKEELKDKLNHITVRTERQYPRLSPTEVTVVMDIAIALFKSYVKACKPEKRELDGVAYTETVEVGAYNKAIDLYERNLLGGK